MKILVIADPIDNQNAGIHVYTKHLIQALTNSANKVYSIRNKKVANDKNLTNIYINSIMSFLKNDPFRLFLKIPKAVNQIKPDFVIEPEHFGPFFIKKNIKRINIIHDLTPVKLPKFHNFHHSLLQKIFLPHILKKSSLIITNSQNTQKDLIDFYPKIKDKAICIYPGYNEYFSVQPDEIITNKENFILSVGTIEPRKNYNTLIDAFEIIKNQINSDLKLIICGGKGWKSKDFYHKLEKHPYRNDIEIRGYVPINELKELYKRTKAFVYPSYYEGFGFPIAEALASGAPCITSNTSSLTEVGGDFVKYFDPNNTKQLANSIIEQIDNPLSVEDIENQRKYINKFSWTKYGLTLEEELNKLLK